MTCIKMTCIEHLIKCPKCNSINTCKNGFVIISGGDKKQRYLCISCGHVWREK